LDLDICAQEYEQLIAKIKADAQRVYSLESDQQAGMQVGYLAARTCQGGRALKD
jgi:hypothetical protein